MDELGAINAPILEAACIDFLIIDVADPVGRRIGADDDVRWSTELCRLYWR
jgi:hypothetical protein